MVPELDLLGRCTPNPRRVLHFAANHQRPSVLGAQHFQRTPADRQESAQLQHQTIQVHRQGLVFYFGQDVPVCIGGSCFARRFGLPTKKTILGLPIGQHITFKAKDADGKDFFRPYTPTTDDDTPGHVDFVIKVYPEGKMSQHLEKLEIGQTMLFKGPKGRYQYQQGSLQAIGKFQSS